MKSFEQYRFKAESLRIAAIACMSPLCIGVLKLITDNSDFLLDYAWQKTLSALILFIVGLNIQLLAQELMEANDARKS